LKWWNRLFPAHEGALPYIYLANLVFPLAFMLQEPVPRLVPGLFLLVLLAELYRRCFWHPDRIPWLIAAEGLITFLLAFFYHPLYLYVALIYVLPLVRMPLKAMYVFSVCFAVGAAGLIFWSGMHRELQLIMMMLPPLFGGVVLPFVVRVSQKYKEMSEQLRLAMGTIERMAQEHERQRIARELHDTLGQTLSLISLKSEIVLKLMERDAGRARREAADIQETARTALNQMRAVVSGMNAVRLREEADHARALCSAAGLELRWETEREEEAGLTALQETMLAMSVREAITNVVRHSRASACEVSLTFDEEHAVLTVRDDGIGMAQDTLARKSGNGVAGIRERLQLIGGALSIDSAPGRGTALTMSVPRVIRNEPGTPAPGHHGAVRSQHGTVHGHQGTGDDVS
jgi:two-component system sensor histidine kinase DesK